MADSTIEDGGGDFIDSRRVRSLCGEISASRLWYYLERRDFPKPLYIGGRRFWRRGDVMAWIERHLVATESPPPPAGR